MWNLPAKKGGQEYDPRARAWGQKVGKRRHSKYEEAGAGKKYLPCGFREGSKGRGFASFAGGGEEGSPTVVSSQGKRSQKGGGVNRSTFYHGPGGNGRVTHRADISSEVEIVSWSTET